ncbi:MAG: hypothetical protein A3F69_00245 [Acidobacteria bacterium RIFCSPLOWO2_12_FULL_66_10]|nr:MAG: hypothetical protein A3F69_00245 [Acidobacteria bacterium RIFCSPLOWO2_12_FULL_66_10]
MPPVSGSAAATSASESAPHSVIAPPTTHRPSITSGSGACRAIPAGDRKMPEPIVMPTTSATELQGPRVLGRRSGVARILVGKPSIGPDFHLLIAPPPAATIAAHAEP